VSGTVPSSGDGDSKNPFDDLTSKFQDKAVEAGLGGWWKRADENKKLAVGALIAAAVLGPLGQGF
jgi:hypothetical protein